LRSVAKDALAGRTASGDRARSEKVRKTPYGPSAPRLRAVAAPAESPAAAAVRARPARAYSSRWHIAACWRALQSVADQLGDPPRHSRYAKLAAEREDLPSPPTLRTRLGPWSQIAAALTQQAARTDRGPANGARARDESVGEGRLATQVEVAALRHLAGHPRSSGTEVRRGAGIRSSSQTWALLARLERQGLLVNESRGSAEKPYKNAWRLSARGEAVLEGLPAGMYAEAPQ
jgi:hypothetical protein